MDKRLKHLEFIQNVITRMNSNSFLIKGFSITLITALIALASGDCNETFILVVYFPIPILWILDSFYLSQERQFRLLYENVSNKDENSIDFSMDTSSVTRINTTDTDDIVKRKKRAEWVPSGFSKTFLIFYLSEIGLSILVLSLI